MTKATQPEGQDMDPEDVDPAELDETLSSPETSAAPTVTYRVMRGITYPAGGGEKRAEPGDLVDDLPESAVEWLLADGAVEPA
jgi:hypothetical protein